MFYGMNIEYVEFKELEGQVIERIRKDGDDLEIVTSKNTYLMGHIQD